jgi:hypothetical protein
MRDKALCLEVLRQVEQAAAKIIARFEPRYQVSDVTGSPTGRLDAKITVPPLCHSRRFIFFDPAAGYPLWSNYPFLWL